ncbi:MAG: hypothetical protein DMG78_31030 [Acidobacteria bacterium]|nr:MAG: hypothetical protein DMG78_31030 [Acidobacteriota bacterium]
MISVVGEDEEKRESMVSVIVSHPSVQHEPQTQEQSEFCDPAPTLFPWSLAISKGDNPIQSIGEQDRGFCWQICIPSE